VHPYLVGDSEAWNTLDAVRAHTKASSSCGQCTAKVEAILAHMGGAIAHRQSRCGI